MKRILVALLAAMLALTPGCGKSNEGTPKTESSVAEEKSAEELLEEKELASITESELVLPEKVAALSKNAAAMWELVGGEVSVGVEEADGVPADSICGSEAEPDIEAVLLHEPDLILIDKTAENYQDMVSLLDMTEDAPAYMAIKITGFADYADTMLEMAKYTKNADAYRTCVIDVRRKNAEIIANGRDALSVLIQTMPVPEDVLTDESTVMQVSGENGAMSDTDSMLVNAQGQETDSMTESSADSVPADDEKVAAHREAVTVLLMRVNENGCTIRCSDDYVSGMLADFGLINVNQGYEDVTVLLPSEDEDEEEKESAVTKAADKAETTEADGQETAGTTAETSGADADSKDQTGAEASSEAEGTEADTSSEAEGADAEASSEAEGAEADTLSEAEGAEAGASSEVEGADAGASSEAEGADAEASSAAEGAEADTSSETKGADAEASAAEEAEAETLSEDKEAETQEALFEKILRRNPDYIYVIYEGKERDSEKTYKAICESQEFWNDMTAVKNRHVYTLPQSTFATPPNEQWDLAYEYLYQMMFVM